MPTDEDRIEVIEAWLEDKHVTLWGIFDVVNLDTRNAAAKWFLKEMQGFFNWVEA